MYEKNSLSEISPVVFISALRNLAKEELLGVRSGKVNGIEEVAIMSNTRPWGISPRRW